MNRALEHVGVEASRCLAVGTSATVTGDFEGAGGAFGVTRVDAAPSLGYAVETCVRAAAEHARVRPFSDESAAFTYTFASGDSSMASSSQPTPTAPPPIPIPTPVSMRIDSRPAPVDLIRRESDALQRCYQQAAQRDHTVSGTIELHITLDASGNLVRVSSHVDTPHEDITLMDLVARCIEAHVRLISFGSQGPGLHEVSVPLTFQPGGIPID